MKMKGQLKVLVVKICLGSFTAWPHIRRIQEGIDKEGVAPGQGDTPILLPVVQTDSKDQRPGVIPPDPGLSTSISIFKIFYNLICPQLDICFFEH